MPTSLSESRTVAVPPERAYDVLLAAPLEDLFTRRRGPIPPIRGTRAVTGGFAAPGDARDIVLSDGGTMRETLVAVDRPRSYGYTLTEVTGAMRLLTTLVEGRWTVEPVGSGSRITWAWTLHPRAPLGLVGVPVLGRFWPGYARAALARLEQILLAS